MSDEKIYLPNSDITLTRRIAIAMIRQTPIKAVIGRDKKETP